MNTVWFATDSRFLVPFCNVQHGRVPVLDWLSERIQMFCFLLKQYLNITSVTFNGKQKMASRVAVAHQACSWKYSSTLLVIKLFGLGGDQWLRNETMAEVQKKAIPSDFYLKKKGCHLLLSCCNKQGTDSSNWTIDLTGWSLWRLIVLNMKEGQVRWNPLWVSCFLGARSQILPKKLFTCLPVWNYRLCSRKISLARILIRISVWSTHPHCVLMWQASSTACLCVSPWNMFLSEHLDCCFTKCPLEVLVQWWWT